MIHKKLWHVMTNIGAINSNHTRKSISDPHYFLTSYFKPMVGETNPTSNLTVSKSILVNLL
jgi:hypothetical protein